MYTFKLKWLEHSNFMKSILDAKYNMIVRMRERDKRVLVVCRDAISKPKNRIVEPIKHKLAAKYDLAIGTWEI